MEQQNTNSMWVRVYSADGFEMSITLAVSSVAEASARLNDIREAGWLPRRPDAGEAGEIETIDTVVRRKTENGVPIIDFYACWSHENKFGAFKYAHKYLDKSEDIAQFEAQSGLKLNDIPLYEGQQAITRKAEKPTRYEIKVRRTFNMKKVKVGQYDDGKAKYEYVYAVPMKVTIAERMIATQDDAKALLTECWNRWELTSENVLKALGVSKLSEWKQSYDAALAQVGAVVEVLQS